MNRNKRILAALDLSLYSVEVLKVAVQLAFRVPGKLMVGNVISKREIEILKNLWNISSLDKWDINSIKQVWQIGPLKNEYHLEGNHCVDTYSNLEVDSLDNLKQERTNMIQDMLKEIAAERLAAEIIFSVGNPFKELLSMVQNNSVNIVVIGSPGGSNLANTLFGTMAEKMYRRCPADVVSIRIQRFPDRKYIRRLRELYDFQSRLGKVAGHPKEGN